MRKFLGRMRLNLIAEFEWLRSYPGVGSLMQFFDRKVFGKSHPMILYLIFILTFGFFFRTIESILLYSFAFILSIYQSFLSLRTGTKTEKNKWSIYWMIYILIMFFEHLTRSYFPPARWFYFVKTFLFFWLLRPGPRGGNHLVYHYLSRLLKFIHNRKLKTKSNQFVVEYSDLVKQKNRIDLLIGQFYTSGNLNSAIEILENSGFRVDQVKDETSFIEKLERKDYRAVWVFSSSSVENCGFIKKLLEFNENGGGIFLLADNAPYVAHASNFLLNKFGLIVDGDFQANKTMFYRENGNFSIGHFGQHEIFHGVKELFEGVTISSPMCLSRSKSISLTTVATGSHAHPCISIFDPPKGSRDGRLCLDCGFTKLFINWNPQETGRYIVNVSNWLINEQKY